MESASDDKAEDKFNALRGQILASTNFYNGVRLSAADSKSASLMAIAGVGLGFIAQRTSLQAETIPQAVTQIIHHPSLLLLFAVIILAILSQRAVKRPGPDWLSHLVAGAPSHEVAEEFLGQSPRDLFQMWITSQGLLIEIANRKYAFVNAATWLLLSAFGLAILGA